MPWYVASVGVYWHMGRVCESNRCIYARDKIAPQKAFSGRKLKYRKLCNRALFESRKKVWWFVDFVVPLQSNSPQKNRSKKGHWMSASHIHYLYNYVHVRKDR